MAIDTHNIVFASELQDILRSEITAVREDETVSAKIPPVMVWGPPGVGKSAIVKAVAKAAGVGFVDVRLAQMESIDIRGLPLPDKDAHCVQWLPSSIFPRENEKGGIIFLDELSAAPKDVQVASYELILDRQLGGGDIYKVPPKWIIVAAGNRSCDRAVSTTMSSALANRMMHLEIEANAQDWVAWAVANGVHPAVIGFIQFKPQLLLSVDDQNLERGFPTPRSWERVSEMCKVIENENLLRKAVYGLVGVSAGTQFMEFHKLVSQMDSVLDMMLDETKKVVVPTRADLLCAMCSSLVYHVWTGKDKEETTKRVGGFIRVAMHLPPSHAQMAMSLVRRGTERVPSDVAVMTLMRHPSYKDWRKKFGDTVHQNHEV